MGSVLDMFWTCSRRFLDMTRTCSGHMLRICCTCVAHVLDTCGRCLGQFVGLLNSSMNQNEPPSVGPVSSSNVGVNMGSIQDQLSGLMEQVLK